MRLISDNRKIDVPYDNYVIYVSKMVGHGGNGEDLFAVFAVPFRGDFALSCVAISWNLGWFYSEKAAISEMNNISDAYWQGKPVYKINAEAHDYG